MLSYKRWSPDSLLRLLVLLFLALGVAGTAGALADWYWSSIPEETRRFWITFASGTTMQVLGITLFASFARQNHLTWHEAFGLRLEETGKMAGLGLVTAVVALAGAMGILLVSQWLMQRLNLPPVQQSSIEALRQAQELPRQVAIAIMAIVLAPVFEEVLFRGILYPALKQAGYPRFALWGSAVLFGLSHMNLLTLLSLTFVGLLLAVLYERTDNLLAPIVAHTAFNGANYAWVVLAQNAG